MNKLLSIQKELKAPKGQFNDFGKYKYRSTEDILEAVKPLLVKHECILTVEDELVNIGERYYIKATAILRDTDKETIYSISGYAREEENRKGMDQSQITGTASSYARKYALNGLFLIDDTKDADSTNKHTDDTLDRLKAELDKYTDPQSLDQAKLTIREKYVKLGLGKAEATTVIAKKLKEFD